MKNKINVIVDCDPGIDDSLALLQILQDKRFNVLGITTTGGNTSAHKGAQNVLKLFELLNIEVPVCEGIEEKYYKGKTIYAEDTHGLDGLGETFIKLTKEHKVAYDLENFVKTIFSSNKEISLICLGPLTNLYRYSKYVKNFYEKVKDIYIMGGNYKSHGNCSQLTEFNFFFDPTAAKYVFKETTKLINLIPLDVTRKIVLTDEIINLIKELNPKIGSFVYDITRFYFDFHKKYENIYACVINDPLVSSFVLNKKILSGFITNVQVIDDVLESESEPLIRGLCLVDKMNFTKQSNNSIVYTKVNVDLFFIEFISSICQVSKKIVKEKVREMGITFKYKYPYEI